VGHRALHFFSNRKIGISLVGCSKYDQRGDQILSPPTLFVFFLESSAGTLFGLQVRDANHLTLAIGASSIAAVDINHYQFGRPLCIPLIRAPPTVMLECVVCCESQPLLLLYLTDQPLVLVGLRVPLPLEPLPTSASAGPSENRIRLGASV
jgi:hypothetical protein